MITCPMNGRGSPSFERAFFERLSGAGVFAVPEFLDEATCRLIRRRMNEGIPEAAEVLDRGVEQSVRRASNIEVEPGVIEDIERRLDRASAGVSTFFGVALGGREGASFLRYGEGGFYKPHRDRGESPDWPDAMRRQVAVVVFLNSSRGLDAHGDFSGGDLQLFVDSDPLDVSPCRGLLVAFPADVLHQVTQVSDGTRDAIVDWYY